MRSFIIYICCLMLFSGCGRSARERSPEEQAMKSTSPPVEAPQPEALVVTRVKPEASLAPAPKAAGQVVESTTNAKPPVAEKTVGPVGIEVIGAERQKKVFEFVVIDGESYPVPDPWKGRKIGEKPNMSALRQIPVAYTLDQSKLYIHEKALEAFVEMAQSAKEDDVHLQVHSGFRSKNYQQKIFSKLMAGGRTWKDLVRYVAPPGYSEHMLGFSVDLYPSNWQFASTKAYEWLKEHGESFGFSETYPQFGQEGYPWEAWHWRFSPSSKAVVKTARQKTKL